jgi:hypothetical protein
MNPADSRQTLAVAPRGRPAPTTVIVWVIGWPIAVADVGGTIASVGSGGDLPFTTVEGALATLSLVTVGAVLVTRLHRHLVGWLLWTGGVLLAVSLGASGLANEGLVVNPGSVPGAIWFAWLSVWTGAPGLLISTVLVPLVFPSGHLPSPRWRPIGLIAVAALAVGVITAMFGPFSTGTFPAGVENPLLIGGSLGDLVSPLHTAAYVVFGVVVFPFAIASILGRLNRATGIEREQLKWFVTVAAIVIVALMVAALGGAEVAWAIAVGGLALMPVAIGVAVLRYRLYDLDIVIRRTIVYVPLSALLAGMYAASISLLQRLFVAFTGHPSDGAIVMSTLILAATFTPIKNALQGRVDRTFRDAQDLERRLRAFTDMVASSVARPDPTRTLLAFLKVTVDATGAGGGRAFVRSKPGDRLVGEIAATEGTAATVVAVELGGRQFGRLELIARQGERPLSVRDVGALQAAADRLAATLGGLLSSPASAPRRAQTGQAATLVEAVD